MDEKGCTNECYLMNTIYSTCCAFHLFYENLSSIHLNMVILSYYNTDLEHLIKRRQIRLSLYSSCCLVAKPFYQPRK